MCICMSPSRKDIEAITLCSNENIQHPDPRNKGSLEKQHKRLSRENIRCGWNILWK